MKLQVFAAAIATVLLNTVEATKAEATNQISATFDEVSCIVMTSTVRD